MVFWNTFGNDGGRRLYWSGNGRMCQGSMHVPALAKRQVEGKEPDSQLDVCIFTKMGIENETVRAF